MNTMIGGKLLSEGGYGCVYYPALTCKLQEEESEKGLKYISKVQRYNIAAKNEIEISSIVRKIPLYKNFFAPIIETCNLTDLKPLMNKKEESCGIFKKRNPGKKYILMKVPYVGSQTFFKYFTGSTNTKEMILKVLSTYTYLTLAVDKLYKRDIIHYDLKGENIIYNTSKKAPIVIDFGLSINLNSVSNKTLSKYFYIYAPDYYLWCPEIHFLSYLTNNNPKPSKEEIFEIADSIVDENIPLHYVCSPSFIKQYRMSLRENLIAFLGKTPMEVFNSMKTTAYTWDSYAISIMYLRILYYLNNEGFVKNDFVIYFTQLLLQNIHPDASRRFTPKETIIMFNNYSFRKDASTSDDYRTIYRNLEKYKDKIVSLVTTDENNLNSMLLKKE